MPQVSVIIPVYNVERYVALSIESALNQTLGDIEIICVNDGSKDSSQAVVEAMARKDGRVRVVNKRNGGLSSARNAGLSVATGDIVCFLDSDDLLVETACDVMRRVFERTGAEVVTYGAYPYPQENSYPWLDEVLSPRRIDYTSFDEDILFGEKSSPFAWRTACRREFLDEIGLRFDESLPYGEDQVFQFQLYPRCSRVSLISDKLVKYRVSRKGSFMDTHVGDLKRLANDHVAIAGRIMEDWKRMGFLDDHSKKALDWISEFSLLKIFELEKEEDRSGAVEAAGKMLLASFDEEILRGYVSEGEGGCFVEAVLYDRSLAAGSRCRKLRLEYCLHAYGRRYLLRRGVEKVLSASPLGKVASFLKGGSKEAERKREAALERWEREDRVQRKRAFDEAAKTASDGFPEWDEEAERLSTE